MTVSQIETNPSKAVSPDMVHRLLNASYAYMVGRIDPPSSLTSMTRDDVARKMEDEDFFVIRDGAQPIACLFGHPEGAAYEVGKLAVATTHRKQGLARALIEAAADDARERGFTTLQLYARVELVENHAIYLAMGFAQTHAFTHDGFAQPTALVFERPL